MRINVLFLLVIFISVFLGINSATAKISDVPVLVTGEVAEIVAKIQPPKYRCPQPKKVDVKSTIIKVKPKDNLWRLWKKYKSSGGNLTFGEYGKVVKKYNAIENLDFICIGYALALPAVFGKHKPIVAMEVFPFATAVVELSKSRANQEVTATSNNQITRMAEVIDGFNLNEYSGIMPHTLRILTAIAKPKQRREEKISPSMLIPAANIFGTLGYDYNYQNILIAFAAFLLAFILTTLLIKLISSKRMLEKRLLEFAKESLKMKDTIKAYEEMKAVYDKLIERYAELINKYKKEIEDISKKGGDKKPAEKISFKIFDGTAKQMEVEPQIIELRKEYIEVITSPCGNYMFPANQKGGTLKRIREHIINCPQCRGQLKIYKSTNIEGVKKTLTEIIEA